jgi:hypothetical protein
MCFLGGFEADSIDEIKRRRVSCGQILTPHLLASSKLAKSVAGQFPIRAFTKYPSLVTIAVANIG